MQQLCYYCAVRHVNPLTFSSFLGSQTSPGISSCLSLTRRFLLTTACQSEMTVPIFEPTDIAAESGKYCVVLMLIESNIPFGISCSMCHCRWCLYYNFNRPQSFVLRLVHLRGEAFNCHKFCILIHASWKRGNSWLFWSRLHFKVHSIGCSVFSWLYPRKLMLAF